MTKIYSKGETDTKCPLLRHDLTRVFHTRNNPNIGHTLDGRQYEGRRR